MKTNFKKCGIYPQSSQSCIYLILEMDILNDGKILKKVQSYIESIHQISYSSLSDNRMLQIFSFSIN